MPPGGRLAVVAVLIAVAAARSPLRTLAWTCVTVCAIVALLAAWVVLARVAEHRIARRGHDGRRSARGGGGLASLSKPHQWPGVPPLHFTSPAAWSMTQTKAAWEAAPDSTRPSLPGAPPFLDAALDSLIALVLRDFVHRWYSNLSDSPVFPAAIDRTLRETLVALSTRVAHVDWAEVLVGRVLPLVTAHLEAFRAADEAVHAGSGDSDEADLFVAARYADLRRAKLHPAVDVAGTNSRPAEEAWLRDLFGAVLPLVVPEREMDSPAVSVLVREVVACAVMLPVFDMLSDPDFYNRTIDDKVRCDGLGRPPRLPSTDQTACSPSPRRRAPPSATARWSTSSARLSTSRAPHSPPPPPCSSPRRHCRRRQRLPRDARPRSSPCGRARGSLTPGSPTSAHSRRWETRDDCAAT